MRFVSRRGATRASMAFQAGSKQNMRGAPTW